MQTVLMNRLSWPEYRSRTLDGDAPVLLPVGATEQHGPHLPLGTDALLASAVAEGVAQKVGGIVAPALAYGFKSQPKCGGGQHFTGTTSLDAATLVATVHDTVREFHRHGLRKLIVVNGHYENQWFLIEGIDLAMRELGPECGLRVMRLEYWDFFTPGTLVKVFPDGFPGYALEHAAVIETSMMLHYHPDMVALHKIPEHGPAEFPVYDIYPTRIEWVPESGVLSSAKGSTAQKGKLLVDDVVEGISRAVRYEFLLPEAS